MKNSIKIIVASAFFALVASSLFAQKMRVGMQGGRTAASQIYFDDNLENRFDRRIKGGNISAFLSLDLAKKWAVQTGLGLSQRGSKCFPGWIGIPVDASFRATYVDLPLELQFEQPLLGRFSLVLGAGGNVGFMARAVRMFPDLEGMPPKEKLILKDSNYRRWDFALQQTVGFRFKMDSKNSVILNARAVEGLRDVIEFSETKNRVVDLRVGFLRAI